MKILIVNIDSTIPNLALKKIERFHLDRGDEVFFDLPMYRNIADKIYVSCVFSENKSKCAEWEGTALIGGTGYDISVRLPLEIENVKPKINWGFTTRGCIRKCPFCVVPKKEGKIKVVGDIYDIWDGKAKEITLMDNNILALPVHFKKICAQLREEKIKVDFNQGLDFRLLNQEIVNELKTISHKEYHFAFDSPSYLPRVGKAIGLLAKNGIKRSIWYVLVGFDTEFSEDIMRLNFLKDHNQNAFVQRYHTVYYKPEYIKVARWANQHRMFHGMTFEQFIESDKKYHKDKYCHELLN